MSENRELLVGPDEGEVVLRGGFGVVNKISGPDTGGTFAIVEHPLEPGALAAPPHTHTNEDEYSFVVEGEVSVMIGEEVFTAAPGSYVLKPWGVPHAFWNAGSEPGSSRSSLQRDSRGISRSYPTSSPPAVRPTQLVSERLPTGTA